MQVVTESDLHDILIEADGDFSIELQHKTAGVATNLTGYTGTGAVKTWARGKTILPLTVIITDAVNGRFTVTASRSLTALMERSGVYAIKFSNGSGGFRVVQGRAHLSAGIG